MKHLKLFTAATACSFLLLSGCKKEIETAVNPTAAKQISELSATEKANLDRLRAALPAGYEEKLKQTLNLLPSTDPEYRVMALRALKAVESPACDDNTKINGYLDQQLADWFSDKSIINNVLALKMLDLPTYDALVFENSSANQSYGVNGEYTQQLTKAFKDLKRFWDIPSNDIIMAAMHGSMLQDPAKVARTYEAVYELEPAVAAELAKFVVELVKAYPQYRGGDHPIFTFNAFALQGFNYQPYATIPDKIIMGDGIMQAYEAIGYGDIAPRAILAHEFGHHIQFELNLFDEVESPEATRRTELMADAYAAYFLSHARGAAMQWKRVQQFLQVFFNIGDCGTTNLGHHGTPTQRMAAANWAYNLANNAQKQGHILSSTEFAELFEAELPNLIKQ